MNDGLENGNLHVGRGRKLLLCEKFHKLALRLPDLARILAFTVRYMVVLTFLTVSTFAFCACGPRITNANLQVVDEQRIKLDSLGKGLSPKEVESILGQPTRQEITKLSLETQKKEVDVARYYYEQDGETIQLHFVDHKLISEVPRLGDKPELPPTP